MSSPAGASDPSAATGKKRRWGGKANKDAAQQGEKQPDIDACVAVLFFHHLLNEDKRAAIVEWALADGLAGLSKAGHPGVVFLAGYDVVALHRFVARLRSLRWQTMEVRLEHQGPRAHVEAVLEGVRAQTGRLNRADLEEVRRYSSAWPNLSPMPSAGTSSASVTQLPADIFVGRPSPASGDPEDGHIHMGAPPAVVLGRGRENPAERAVLYPAQSVLGNQAPIAFLELGRHNSLGLVPELLGRSLWPEVVRTPPADPSRYRLAVADATGVVRGVSEDLWKGMTPAEKRAFDEGGAGPCEIQQASGGGIGVAGTQQSVMAMVS